MKRTDARKLPIAAQEEKRSQAIRMLKKSKLPIKEIAKILEVHYGTVCRWIREYKRNGIGAIKAKKRGRKFGELRTLDSEQEKIIRQLIVKNTPEKFGFNLRLWTRQGVILLIQKTFDIEIPIRTVGEYLKRWNFTPQKPKKRAYEKNEKHVQNWLKNEYPKIIKRAKNEKAIVHWGDETGISNVDQRGRSYSPKGKTPVVVLPGTSKIRINLISTITNKGKLRFMLFEKNMNARILIEFLSRLIKDSKQKVFLILDNLNTHKTKQLKDWLKENKAKIEVFYLPTYSPDLNPDEFLNCDLKRSLSSKLVSFSKEQMKKKIVSQMTLFQKNPERIKKYL